MRSILLCFLIGFTGCLDEGAPEPEPASEQVDLATARIDIPQELVLAPEGVAAIAAHSNCGHMVYCSSGGHAVYCYYKRSSTGCSLQNIEDDFNSDCQYVCGHKLCLNARIEAC